MVGLFCKTENVRKTHIQRTEAGECIRVILEKAGHPYNNIPGRILDIIGTDN